MTTAKGTLMAAMADGVVLAGEGGQRQTSHIERFSCK